MKYEDYVRKFCGETWKTISDQERQGGYGVAVMFAYLRGVKPTLNDVAKHLGVTADEINIPFVRLLRNGAFHKDKWKSKTDSCLTGEEGDDEAHRAWGFVAAVSGGFLGSHC